MRWAASLSKPGDKGSIGGNMGMAWTEGAVRMGQLGTQEEVTHPGYT